MGNGMYLVIKDANGKKFFMNQFLYFRIFAFWKWISLQNLTIGYILAACDVRQKQTYRHFKVHTIARSRTTYTCITDLRNTISLQRIMCQPRESLLQLF